MPWTIHASDFLHMPVLSMVEVGNYISVVSRLITFQINSRYFK